MIFFIIVTIVIICVIEVLSIGSMIKKKWYSLYNDELIILYEEIEKFNNKILKNNKINIPTYYINLDRCVERKNNLIKEFKKFSPETKLTRIKSVDGKLIKNNTFINFIDKETQFLITKQSNYTKGEIACTLSHLHAIKTAYNNGDDYALIIEDDVSLELSNMWPYSLKELIDKSPKDCGIIQLFSFEHTFQNNETLFTFRKRNLFFNYSSTLGYVIKRSAMKFHLSNFINNKIVFPNKRITADYFIYDIGPNLQTYLVNNWVIPKKNNDSTLHNNHLQYQNFQTSKIIFNNFHNGTIIPNNFNLTFLNVHNY
jgi:GR25 family glycosyltransferase involved in LPS biosynthesis